MVLRRRPDHRRAADVDQLDAGIGREGVEVDDHEVDRLDPVLGEIGAMRRIRRVGEDSSVHLRVQGHDAVTEDCREPGELGDVRDRHPAGRDLPRRAAARQHPPAGGMEPLGEFGDPRLVVHGQQRGGHGGTVAAVMLGARTARVPFRVDKLKALKVNDWLVVAGGVLVLVFGLFRWFSWEVSVENVVEVPEQTSNAFDYLLTGVVPWLLIVGAAIVTVLLATEALRPGNVPWPLVLLAATAARVRAHRDPSDRQH